MFKAMEAPHTTHHTPFTTHHTPHPTHHTPHTTHHTLHTTHHTPLTTHHTPHNTHDTPNTTHHTPHTTHHSPHTTHLVRTRISELQTSFLVFFHGALSYPVWSHRNVDHKDSKCQFYRPVHGFTKITNLALFSPLSNSCCRHEGM